MYIRIIFHNKGQAKNEFLLETQTCFSLQTRLGIKDLHFIQYTNKHTHVHKNHNSYLWASQK